MYFPDARLEEPNVFLGRKPTGPVVIDWSNPLAKGLAHYILFQNESPRDLVTGTILSKFGGPIWTPSGHLFDESDDYCALENVTINSCFTIFLRPAFTDNIGLYFQYFFSWGAVNSGDNLNFFLGEMTNGDGNTLFWAGPGAFNEGINVSNWYPDKSAARSVIAVKNRNATVFANEKELATSSTWAADSLADGTTRTLYLGTRNDLNSVRFFGGTLDYVLIYNSRRLPDAMIRALSRNPYQILIPA